MASITRRNSKNTYMYLAQTLIYDVASGKKVRKNKTINLPLSLTEAQAYNQASEMAEEWEKELNNKIKLGYSLDEYTVSSYIPIYLDYVEKSSSPGYLERINTIMKVINRHLGQMKLSDLTPQVIQEYFDYVDTMKKVTERVIPNESFNATLSAYGFTYHKLRYEMHIQHSSLTNAIKGGSVKMRWATTLSQKTKIPFDELFTFEKREEEYSYSSRLKYKTYLRQMLAYAKRQRIIKDNFATADFVFYTKTGNRKEISAMDEDQAKKFYDTLMTVEDERIKTALLLFLLGGFRRGEVGGLKWEDIDFEKKKITINRSLTYTPSKGTFLKEPKTKRSQRTITMPELLEKQLLLYKDFSLGVKEDDFLFSGEHGNLIFPGTFLDWLKRVLDMAELPNFTIHSLRHTNITLQIASGVPLITVSGRAGHSRTSTTTDIYSHFISSSDSIAAEAIDQIFEEEYQEPKEKLALNKIEEFKKAKAEMKELGFETMEEYMEYKKFISMNR